MMNLFKSFTGLLAALGITLGGVATASSAELLSEEQLAPAPSGWEFSMTPYAWVLFITGDMTAGVNTSDINTNLFEIIDESDEIYAFMSEQELRKGKVGIFADFLWAKVNAGGSKTIDLEPIPGLNVNTLINSNVKVEVAVFEPGAAYEVFKRSSGGSFKDPDAAVQTTAVDFLAGARYWYIKNDIALNTTTTVSIPALGLSKTGAGRVAGKKTIDWWDPYIGLRVRQNRGPGKELVLRGDIGGFGVGSDFSWQLEGSYIFDTKILGHNATATVGYRALYADYSQGSGINTLGFDWLWHGPTLGLKFTW
jgi:hypothetical protein